jgi:hypothetical protein
LSAASILQLPCGAARRLENPQHNQVG